LSTTEGCSDTIL